MSRPVQSGKVFLLIVVTAILSASSVLPVPVRAQDGVLCTFTARVNVNLREGPGTGNRIVGRLRAGESIGVTGQASGQDGYAWWAAGASWLRADLGTSDCAPVCGNLVCETGETASNCSRDCRATTSSSGSSTSTTSSGGTSGCVANSCQACYESISCYPACSQCTCSENQYGCPVCNCVYPGGTNTSNAATSTGCVFESCEACIAAFPCPGGPCGTTQCSLNEHGCPVCSTAP